MDMQVSKMVDAAKEVLKAYGYFIGQLWHVNDVHFICEQHNISKIGDEEAMEVFLIASEQFDGETGISWPQLEKALMMYVKRKVVLSSEFCGNDS